MITASRYYSIRVPESRMLIRSRHPAGVVRAVLIHLGARSAWRGSRRFCRRVRQIVGVMSFSSAVKLAFQRRAPFVDVLLKTSMSFCRLRPRSSDIDCLGKVFLWEEYKLPFAIEPTVIIDGGDNVEAASLYFASKYPP